MKKCIYFILLTLAASGCRDRSISLVPNVPVNISINISLPDFFNLSVPTGWVYITGGSRGIIVYRKSESEFIAIERHSTYQAEDNCAIVVMADGIILDDPCSESQWLITDGTIVNGPANMPLVTYDTSFSNQIVHITN